jgi:uncharacterized protein (DUF433 family)
MEDRTMDALLEMERIYTELGQIRQDLETVKVQLERMAKAVDRPLPTDHPYVVRKPGPHGGEPLVRDTALSVRTIVQRVQMGESPEQIVEIFPVLTLAQVYDALSYYHEHTAEIEQYIRENEAALWRVKPSGSL